MTRPHWSLSAVSLAGKPAPISLMSGQLQAALFPGVGLVVSSGWCVLSISCAMSIARPWFQTHSHPLDPNNPPYRLGILSSHFDARYGDTSPLQTCKSPSLHFLVYEMGSPPSTSHSPRAAAPMRAASEQSHIHRGVIAAIDDGRGLPPQRSAAPGHFNNCVDFIPVCAAPEPRQRPPTEGCSHASWVEATQPCPSASPGLLSAWGVSRWGRLRRQHSLSMPPRRDWQTGPGIRQ